MERAKTIEEMFVNEYWRMCDRVKELETLVQDFCERFEEFEKKHEYLLEMTKRLVDTFTQSEDSPLVSSSMWRFETNDKELLEWMNAEFGKDFQLEADNGEH